MHRRRMIHSRSSMSALPEQRPASKSVALLLTEASRTRARSMTEVGARSRCSPCLKCGEMAEMCVLCANKTARSAVQFYRQARLEGSSHILKSCLVRAGGNYTVKSIVFALWKNHVQKQSRRLQKIRAGMERMISRRTAATFVAWLRFTKMSVQERLVLEIAQQRIGLADAQQKSRTFELQHNALQEEVDGLKREVARLNMATAQRDRTIAALTAELQQERENFAMVSATAVLLLRLLFSLVVFTTQMLGRYFHQLRCVLELIQVNCGLDNFNSCLPDSLRQELQQRVPLLLLSFQSSPANPSSEQPDPSNDAPAPTASVRERRLSRLGTVGELTKTGAADSVSLADRIMLAWLNHMSQEADRVFPLSGCGPDSSRLPAFQQLTTLSELSQCQQLVRVVFTLLVVRTAEFGQHSKVQVQPPVVPLTQAQAFLSQVESHGSSPYAVAQRILVTVHELFRLPPKLRTAQTILSNSVDRLRVFCNLLIAAFPPVVRDSVEHEENVEQALTHVQAYENAVERVTGSIHSCKAAATLAALQTDDNDTSYPSNQTIELLRKLQADEATKLENTVKDLTTLSDRLQFVQEQTEMLREQSRLGSALAVESRKEVNRSCLEDLAVLIV